MTPLRQALINALQSISRVDRGWIASFSFPKDSPVFAGHFPGTPILPGVVLILMAQTVLEEMHEHLALHTLLEAKFFTPLPPETLITLTVLARDTGIWECTVTQDKKIAARLRFSGAFHA